MKKNVAVENNKVSAYLIKEGFAKQDSLKNFDALSVEDIGNIGEICYGSSYIREPSWLNSFFGSTFDNEIGSDGDRARHKMATSSSKAVFFISVKKRLFAVVFGYGNTLLKPGSYEEGFGLKVALGIIKQEHIRSIDKKNMSTAPKLSKEQLSKAGSFFDFGVDLEQDLIQGITGQSGLDVFGKMISGKDSISFTSKTDVSNIKDLLDQCLDIYVKESYKTNYPWIDNVMEIRDPVRVSELDLQLVEMIKNSTSDDIYAAVPEIIEWSDVSGFYFKKHNLGNDIIFSDILRVFKKEGVLSEIDVAFLKNHNIQGSSSKSGEEIYSWNIYSCLGCEIDDAGETCVLSGGKWYKINKDFTSQVKTEYQEILKRGTALTLPICESGLCEGGYNEIVEKESPSYKLMDKKLIMHGNGSNSIEFCDIFAKTGEIIHVKHRGASSVLSHLFAQGLVSAELMLSDKNFLAKVNGLLGHGFEINGKPDAKKFKIVYAVIDPRPGVLRIPFFSMVNIRNADRRLRLFGFEVYLQKIEVI